MQWENFCIDVTFEMKTVLSEIRLFNDDISKHGYHIYMKWKEGEKEQDSGEIERESLWETERGREGR